MKTLYRFNLNALHPGDIIRRRSYTPVGWAIRASLPGCWSNHDAPWVPKGSNFYIGDAQFPKAVLTDYHAYENDLDAGKCEVRVCRPTNATLYQGIAAAKWWRDNVEGKPYDLAAYPQIIYQTGRVGRIIVKAIWGKNWPKEWEWSWYCTEGVSDAWAIGGKTDIYGDKFQPTPLTTQKRNETGELMDITKQAIVIKIA